MVRPIDLKSVASPAAAVALPLLLLTIAFFAGVHPAWQRHQQLGEDVEAAAALLSRHGSEAETIRALRADLEQRTRQAEADDSIFPLQTEGLATALLSSKIKQISDSQGATIKSTQALSSAAAEAMTRLSIRVELSGTSQVLQKVIYQVEAHRPFLFIDSLELRQERIGDPAALTPDPILVAVFEISALMRRTAS
jgi:general secretion pathway protein M